MLDVTVRDEGYNIIRLILLFFFYLFIFWVKIWFFLFFFDQKLIRPENWKKFWFLFWGGCKKNYLFNPLLQKIVISFCCDIFTSCHGQNTSWNNNIKKSIEWMIACFLAILYCNAYAHPVRMPIFLTPFCTYIYRKK